MASGLNQPKSESGVVPGSAFGQVWRSQKSPGPETVISNGRVVPPGGVNGSDSVLGHDLSARLFPSNMDVENVSGILIGHFRIQRRIGVGGMGSVFLALDERLKRDVALKVLSPSLSLDQNSIQRFQNEAQAAARLDHDNIARVFYSGEETGLHYIAYEYVPGQNLRDVIRSKGWLDPAEAVNYAIQLTAALHHSSSAGVIHRDIKPSNVLITPYGRAKLVDLGLARKTSLDSSFELTVPGTTMGTFDYISPEQARDPHSVDVRSDIYSLGCTMYHMLTGEPPYPEGTVLQKLLDHQAKDPPDPAKKNRRVSPMLSHVVRKMMASQPAHRYATPGDLLRDLLLVARSLGSGAVPIDGQVWLTATRFKPPFWQSNFGWVATTLALCFLVLAVQFYPSLADWTVKREKAPRPQSNTSTSSDNRTAQNSDRPGPVIGDLDSMRRESKKEFGSTQSLSPLVNDSAIFKPETEVANPLAEPRTSILDRPSEGFSATPLLQDKPVVSPILPDPIQILNGKSYANLESACAEASESGNVTIIELRYNGARNFELPIRLTNKKVVIRAAEGYRPSIRFSVAETAGDSQSPAMITVAGGSLELLKVDLVMVVPKVVPSRVSSERWSLFSFERPDKVELTGVNITIVNPYNKPVCVFEQSASGGAGAENSTIRSDGMPIVPPELKMTECLVRGQGDFIVMRDIVPARYELKDVAIGVDGNLLQMRLVMDATAETIITLDLDKVTFRYGQSLLAVEGTGGQTERLPKILVFARNSILACGSNYPLISMRGIRDYMDFQKSFSWKGNFNFYDEVETFLELSTVQQTGTRRWDHIDWKSLTNEGAGSSNRPVLWKQKTFDKSYGTITAENFTLATDSQPATNGASDGNAAGVTLSKLPPLDK